MLVEGPGITRADEDAIAALAPGEEISDELSITAEQPGESTALMLATAGGRRSGTSVELVVMPPKRGLPAQVGIGGIVAGAAMVMLGCLGLAKGRRPDHA